MLLAMSCSPAVQLFLLGCALCLLAVLESGCADPGAGQTGSCPWACACAGATVDCSHRGLFQVPKHMPPDAERIDLQGNNITIIFQSDFQNNKKLKILQLSDNQIHTIERDALNELAALERLDLSRNELTALGKRSLRGLTNLRSLSLDNNRLKCIDDRLLDQFKYLEILTVNSNRLTHVTAEGGGGARLHMVRAADNPLVCDCRLSRLAAALARAGGARCAAPAALRGALLADVGVGELVCAGPSSANSLSAECSAEPRCPVPCRCTADGTVDCREKALSKLPQAVPDSAVEIRLEQNEISDIGHKAFASQKKVRRIDLSNNRISKLAPDAFSGLKSLVSLVLYGNKIKDLPGGIFYGLASLELLLLNSNEITCIRKDTFRDLKSLNLLSLYDNNIHTLPNGTFDSLVSIKTLHLARNPFACECGLRWLAAYLRKNPIETSGARCELPKKLNRKRIETLKDESFKCKPGDEPAADTGCGSQLACPASCSCEYSELETSRGSALVECIGVHLTELPKDLPMKTSQLILPDNKLSSVRSDGLLGRLPHLTRVDLRHNVISNIEDNAFDGAALVAELLLDGNKLTTVSDKMFLGLHSLSLLSLSDNQISCITPGAFDHLQMLQTLSLDSNPLACTCHLTWLAGWLKSRGVGVTATCASPESLATQLLVHVPAHEFKCTNAEVGCLAADYCPLACSCTGTVVRCARAKLASLPDNIPRQTTELYLESNEITQLSGAELSHLTQLTRLDLSNNKISVLANETFQRLTKLSTLIVSYNRLRCVQRDALKGLSLLRVLSLHGNNISTFPEGVFRDLDSITHIALGSNPLYCDCAMRWLSEWVKRDYVEPGIARCAFPPAMKDKLLLSTQSGAFLCKGKPPNDILSKCNACYRSPCANGGSCAPTATGGYRCACARGYHGDTCHHMIDACYGSPCANGATCTLLEEGRFNCSCVAGYTGMRCEVDADDCVQHSCRNNATCVDRLNGYSCRCADGFMGEFCESKIPFCTAEFNPCKNGAECQDRGTHYECLCPRGYSGENCTVNVDDCANNMCQNGAMCVDGVDEYSCACAEGYAGRYCEAAPGALYAQTSPCAQHECVHGVCYLPTARTDDQMVQDRPTGVGSVPASSVIGNTNNDYLCKCAPGYSGRLCEYLTSLTFVHNNSLVELEALRTKPDANVTLVFSSTQHHGVLLYFGSQEHLAVELFNGRIRISYDVGNHPVSTMYSFEMVADGAYHKAELLSVSKNFTLMVDGGPARSIINEGPREFLRLTTPLYLGGVPHEVGRHALASWHLRNLTSFKGCLKEAWINHKQVDFLNAARQVRVTPGCGDAEEHQPAPSGKETSPAYHRGGMPAATMLEDGVKTHQDPCMPNPCKRGGRCIPEEGSSSDYTCRCRAGTRGAQCELLASIGGASVSQLANKANNQRNRPGSGSTSIVGAQGVSTFSKQTIAQSPSLSVAAESGSVATGGPAPCRKEATREYFSERGCRSRRPVRSARCAGSPRACGRAQCCAPRKTKRRKVRLVCPDGTRYTKEVDVVRKCACSRKCKGNAAIGSGTAFFLN